MPTNVPQEGHICGRALEGSLRKNPATRSRSRSIFHCQRSGIGTRSPCECANRATIILEIAKRSLKVSANRHETRGRGRGEGIYEAIRGFWPLAGGRDSACETRGRNGNPAGRGEEFHLRAARRLRQTRGDGGRVGKTRAQAGRLRR